MYQKLGLTIFMAVVSTLLTAQCLYQKIEFDAVVDHASMVVDGKVISTECIWNADHSMIYTRYGIRVYTLYKGQADSIVYFNSPGGIIDLKAIKVEPSVHPQIGSFGLFMTSPADESSKLPQESLHLGFGHLSWYPYNFITGKASGVFQEFDLSKKELERAIVAVTGLSPQSKTKLPIVKKPVLLANRAVTGFSPASITAGTASTLTINGSGFGSVADTVFFLWASNPTYLAYTLPSDIVSWSNTQIKVLVPDDAGTGPVYVSTSTSNGPNQFSSSNVNILSAQTNVKYQNSAYSTRHSNPTNTGKISFQLNTAFNNNNSARLSLARAMKTWRCTNNVNIEINPTTTSVNTIADDNVNVIKFSSLSEALGKTYTYFQGCYINSVLYWHTTEIDMEYDDVFTGATWNFETSTPTSSQYDFESVTLHELGHALLLAHVIDENKVMHRSIPNGVMKRIPSSDESSAVTSVMQRSTSNANTCGFFPITNPGNITVSSTADGGTGSLRQAVADVCNADTIVFSVPTASTLTLNAGEIAVGSDMKIHGLDINSFVISGNNTGRIFNVAPGKSLTLQNMKLINATSTTNGGAIYNQGSLFLKNVQFQNTTQGALKKAFSSGTGTTVTMEGNVQFKL